jgi:hypothetical protein
MKKNKNEMNTTEKPAKNGFAGKHEDAQKQKTKQKRKKRDVRNKVKIPLFEAVSHDQIFLKSYSGETKSLLHALNDSWEMCKQCGQFYTTKESHEIYINDGFCLSEICKKKYGKYEPTALPVERICVYAQVLSKEKFTESLLYYLFYEVDELKVSENARLHLYDSEDKDELIENAKISMELWSSIGIVWVKRGKGGKFRTWKTYS